MNNHTTSCDEFVAGFVIERYAAGQLSESETVAFEEHLLVCDRCQQELTLAVAVREALPEAESPPEDEAPPGEEADAEPVTIRRLPWRGMGIAVTLAAAAVATILILPRGRVSPPVAELGRVTQPPIYLGGPVRQAPARPDSVFGAAMSAYTVGDYSKAAAGLEAALAVGADSACSQFFRGASLLMLDRDREAADAFDTAIAAGESPYLTEAHYYLAKALLRLGDADGALAQLNAAGVGESEVAALARALTDSVTALSDP